MGRRLSLDRAVSAERRGRHRAGAAGARGRDRKSTRLNSSHLEISYAVFCLKKKKKQHQNSHTSSTYKVSIPPDDYTLTHKIVVHNLSAHYSCAHHSSHDRVSAPPHHVDLY